MTAEEAFLDAIQNPEPADTEEEEQLPPELQRALDEGQNEEYAGWSKRPDPNEPWRYACPDCGSTTLNKLKGGKRPEGKKYSFHASGVHEIARDRMKRYRCRDCGERKMTVIDRTDGSEVKP